MNEAEEQRIEVWKMDCFLRLGFDSVDAALLVQWNVDPHDADHLLYRHGERTKCSIETAMEILQPAFVAA